MMDLRQSHKPGLIAAYVTAIREEPKLRAYLLASIIDDIGIAASVWAVSIMFVNLFTDQTQRARFMIPNLICFLGGSLIAGPLADWARDSLSHLARWRWRLVVWGRVAETVALGLAMWGVAGGELTIARILPYALIRSFMKTGLGATRKAFEVDLLSRQEVQRDDRGELLLDEHDQPRMYKVHLLSFCGMTSCLAAAAAFGGLLLGGKILDMTGGKYLPIFAFDVLTNLGFIALVIFGCHPDRRAKEVGFRDLLGEREGAERIAARAHSADRSIVGEASRELLASLREVVRFLRQPAQRPLVYLLIGRWMIQIINEFYDGKMMVKHVMHGSDDAVRHAEIVWSLAEIAVLMWIPLLARGVGSLGKVFLVTMFLDGIIMAVAGRISALGAAGAVVPFVCVLAADRALTSTSDALATLAQNSASSAALRGRLTAVFVFVVILSDLLAQLAATALAAAVGIPGTLFSVGIGQIVLMAVIAALGGRALWSFGLRSTPLEPPAAEPVVAPPR